MVELTALETRRCSTVKVNLERMKHLRKAKGLTQLEMARLLGYKTNLGYFYLENGRCQIKANHLPLIAAALEVDISTLFEPA